MKEANQEYKSFSELAASESLSKGKFEDFVKEVLAVLTLELEISRASFWLYKPTKEAFENMCLYEHDTHTFSKEHAIWERDSPKFYSYLINNHYFKADDVLKDERLTELTEDYYVPNEIKSAMGRQIWYNGVLLGFLMVEETWKTKNWANIEEIHLHIATSFIIQAYNSKQWLARYHPEKMSDGDLSEFVDQEKEEMKRKLTDHAFYASHNIRHPITTILALTDLIKANWDDRENYESLLTQLKVETMNLDEMIRVMSAKIELD